MELSQPVGTVNKKATGFKPTLFAFVLGEKLNCEKNQPFQGHVIVLLQEVNVTEESHFSGSLQMVSRE
jgi:hypothetical protein